MKIGADRPADAAALVAGVAVVPETGHDTAERLAPGSRRVRPAWFSKPATVRRWPGSSSQSSRTSPIIRRSPATVSCGKRPTPGMSPVPVAVAAPEQLVAAADGEDRHAALDRLLVHRALRGEIRRDQRLLAILAAADVEQVVLAGTSVVAD